MRDITQSDVDEWRKLNPNTELKEAPQWIQDWYVAQAEAELIAEGKL